MFKIDVNFGAGLNDVKINGHICYSTLPVPLFNYHFVRSLNKGYPNQYLNQ